MDTDNFAELAEAAEAETQKLLAEGLNAVNGIQLTVQDVLDDKLDETIDIDTAIVNASKEVYAAMRIEQTQSLQKRLASASKKYSLLTRQFVMLVSLPPKRLAG